MARFYRFSNENAPGEVILAASETVQICINTPNTTQFIQGCLYALSAVGTACTDCFHFCPRPCCAISPPKSPKSSILHRHVFSSDGRDCVFCAADAKSQFPWRFIFGWTNPTRSNLIGRGASAAPVPVTTNCNSSSSEVFSIGGARRRPQLAIGGDGMSTTTLANERLLLPVKSWDLGFHWINAKRELMHIFAWLSSRSKSAYPFLGWKWEIRMRLV